MLLVWAGQSVRATNLFICNLQSEEGRDVPKCPSDSVPLRSRLGIIPRGLKAVVPTLSFVPISEQDPSLREVEEPVCYGL